MFKRFAALAAAMVMYAACATVPAPRLVQNSFPFDKPFDQVWQALIELLSDFNMPILNMEKVSGLITVDWFNITGEGNQTGYSDCGKAGIGVEQIRRGKLNVYIKTTSENSCEMRVNTFFEQVIAFGNIQSARQCVSTGKLESRICTRVQEKLK